MRGPIYPSRVCSKVFLQKQTHPLPISMRSWWPMPLNSCYLSGKVYNVGNAATNDTCTGLFSISQVLHCHSILCLNAWECCSMKQVIDRCQWALRMVQGLRMLLRIKYKYPGPSSMQAISSTYDRHLSQFFPEILLKLMFYSVPIKEGWLYLQKLKDCTYFRPD